MICRAIAVVVALLLPMAATAADTTVETGRIEGTQAGDVTVYKGVPFAAPPMGALRWRAPQPASAWPGVRKADKFAPACMQTGVSMPGETPPPTSEDCLYLNIWTPAKPAGQTFPVLVWIHGGGFANGSASMPLYWGDRLAARGIVVVTVAYRLGPFGFLAHPELTAESADHASGDYGLMDQVAALQWVQRNIAAFGGDPGSVTIAGQSAGAMSVSMMMAEPRAKGLFARAIAQSGGIFEPMQLAPNWALANAEKEGAAYAASLGAHSLADLRALPAVRLLEGKASQIDHPVLLSPALPRLPYEVFAAGDQSHVPILIGSNAQEARALVDLAPVTVATYQADLEKHWGKLPGAIVAAYPYASDVQAKEARADLERDLRFGWDMWAWARLQAAAGAPVYRYYFAQSPPFPAGSVRAGWGASHYAEMWYMFDHLDQERWAWTAADRRLARAISGYWVNFVKTGDPNGRGLPRWTAFTTAGGETQYLADPIRSTGPSPNLASLRAFDAVYTQIRGAPSPAKP